METEQTKTTVFSKIRTASDAIKIIKDCGLAFVVIASAQIIMGALSNDRLLLISALVLGLLTLWMRNLHSRLAAMTILISSIGVAIAVLVDQPGLTGQRIAMVVLAAIVLFLSIRGVQATFFLAEAESKEG